MGRVLDLLGLGERSRAERGGFLHDPNSAPSSMRSRVSIVFHGVYNIASEVSKLDLQEGTKAVMRGDTMPTGERTILTTPNSDEILKAAGIETVPFVPETVAASAEHPTEAQILELIAGIHARDDSATQPSMPHLARTN